MVLLYNEAGLSCCRVIRPAHLASSFGRCCRIIQIAGIIACHYTNDSRATVAVNKSEIQAGLKLGEKPFPVEVLMLLTGEVKA
jgi:hypothetical protein